MSLKNKQAEVLPDDESRHDNSNIVVFDDENRISTGKDINSKISGLDTDLAQLRKQLEVINNSVEVGLYRLGDKDTDLTAKVAETYKRLGEIDNAYRSMLDISTRIDHDIQRLNSDVSDVAEQSAAGIENLKQSSVNQSKKLAKKNQKVAAKVNQLVETSKLSSEMMQQSIQSVTDKMLLIENNLLMQIENLATETTDKTQAIEKTVDHSNAKILKLQHVDEAIIRRATSLEATTAELTTRNQYLDSSVEQLQISSDNLSGSIRTLSDRARELEELTASHGQLIDTLQKAGADTLNRLRILSGREMKHFRFSLVSIVLLLMLVAAVYFSQQYHFGVSDTRFATTSNQMTGQISDLQQVQLNYAQNTEKSLAVLEDKMLVVQDQLQSVEGRFNKSSPFSHIGDDNLIHGPQWIASLPQENFTVQLAFVNDKNALFEIAQRYNYWLKDTLSYFRVSDNGVDQYVLLSGNFTTRQQAVSAVDAMPSYINRHKPVIRKVESIQKYIAE